MLTGPKQTIEAADREELFIVLLSKGKAQPTVPRAEGRAGRAGNWDAVENPKFPQDSSKVRGIACLEDL